MDLSGNIYEKMTPEEKRNIIKNSRNEKDKFRCDCCGKETVSPSAFPVLSYSKLHEQRNGRVPLCKDCITKIYNHASNRLGHNNEKVIEYLCAITDLYYDEDAAKRASINPGVSCFSKYRSNLSNIQRGMDGDNLTYLDTSVFKIKKKEFIDSDIEKIEERVRKECYDESVGYQNTISELEQKIKEISDENENLKNRISNGYSVVEKDKSGSSFVINDALREFWGFGLEDNEYRILQRGYNECVENMNLEEVPFETKKSLKFLILVEFQMTQFIREGKDVKSLASQFQSLSKACGLNNDKDITKDTFGTFIAQIEGFTPADIHKDKGIFGDHYGVKDYIERFLFRPVKNLFTGSKEKEKEFWINDDDS